MLLMGLPGKYFPTVVTFWEWLGPDKIAHLLLFAAFSFASLWGYRKKFLNKNYHNKKKLFTIVCLTTISYGGITELLQKYLFINRYCSLFDFIADLIGCVIGIFIFILFLQKKIKKIRNSGNIL